MKNWFSSVIDSFPKPWSILPRASKYYGTVIQDARGLPILSFWEYDDGEPSQREKEYFGDWTPESWEEYCSDSHWESAAALALAEKVVFLRNDSRDFDMPEDLILAILQHGRWKEDIWAEIVCGGPGRRSIT